MKKIITFLLLLVAAACTTPREDCVNNAVREYNVLSSAISESERNIARGYAVHRQSVPYNYAGSCYDYYIGTYSCMKSGTRLQETPVAIDVNEERRTLSALKTRLPSVRNRAEMSVAQCQAQFPE